MRFSAVSQAFVFGLFVSSPVLGAAVDFKTDIARRHNVSNIISRFYALAYISRVRLQTRLPIM